jgi:hypothetical protein
MVLKTNDHKYTTFIVPVMYDINLPIYFNNQVRFLNEYMDDSTLNKSTMHEKQEIKWFSIDQLRKDRNTFRPFYHEIVDQVIERETDLMNLFGKKNKKKRNTTAKCSKHSEECSENIL